MVNLYFNNTVKRINLGRIAQRTTAGRFIDPVTARTAGEFLLSTTPRASIPYLAAAGGEEGILFVIPKIGEITLSIERVLRRCILRGLFYRLPDGRYVKNVSTISGNRVFSHEEWDDIRGTVYTDPKDLTIDEMVNYLENL